ncbi:MAG TPA: alpha/beta hydrolase, partial [Rhizomicrobium sp.]|nr:alpha/beta hydrolase [Rhizomicrobium sp.]
MTKFAKAPDGVRIAYEIVGDGADTIVLVHGFASSRVQNWRDTGWYNTLTKSGLRVVAMDCRGHGDSDKPHDDAAYGDKMVSDIVSVMDAAGVARAAVMGYS